MRGEHDVRPGQMLPPVQVECDSPNGRSDFCPVLRLDAENVRLYNLFGALNVWPQMLLQLGHNVFPILGYDAFVPLWGYAICPFRLSAECDGLGDGDGMLDDWPGAIDIRRDRRVCEGVLHDRNHVWLQHEFSVRVEPATQRRL